MPDRILVLVPPSEGKAPGGHGPPWDPDSGRFAELAPRRAAVAAALAESAATASSAHLAKLLGVKGEHLERAVAANGRLVGAPTMPAASRYQGVVWEHLDLDGLGRTARRRAGRELAVVSGLSGLVGIDDPVPDYRIKLGARLGDLGRLSRWWRPGLDAVLAPVVRDRLVVDALANEQADAWTHDGPQRLRVRFRAAGAGGSSRWASGHAAKAVKGRLIRHLVERDGKVLDALVAFDFEGWRYDEAGSGASTAVFVRGDVSATVP